MPDPATYDGEFGDAYAVGTETPYDLYIWTRAFSGTTGSFWFNIGAFPAPSTVPGPIGPQGIQGEEGQRGSFWYTQSGAPTNTEGVNENDQALDGTSGDVYQFVEGEWQLVGNIRGPQGIQGIQGIVGPEGPVGPTGPVGPQGPQGQFIQIIGTLTDVNQLPDPTSVPRSAAYLVPVSGAEHVFLIVGEGTEASPLTWHDAGGFGGGTAVTIDGVPQSTIEMGYVPKISINYEIGEDTTVTSNGSEVTFSNMQTTGINAANEQIEGAAMIELPIASSEEIAVSVKSNTMQMNLTDDVWETVQSMVDEAQPAEVQITAPTTSTNGQLTAYQLATLQGNKGAYLMFNNEIYRLQDTQHTSGYLVYSHLGYENTTQVYNIKCITITISTRGWVLTTRQVVNPSELSNYVSKTTTATQTMQGFLYDSAGMGTTYLAIKKSAGASNDTFFDLNSNNYEMNYNTFAHGIHLQGKGGTGSYIKKTYLQLPNSGGTEINTTLPDYNGDLIANMSGQSGGAGVRFMTQNNVASTSWFKLARLPKSDASNAAAITFTGFIGGWVYSQVVPCSFSVANREEFVCNVMGGTRQIQQDRWQIRGVTNSDESIDVYLVLQPYSTITGMFTFAGLGGIINTNTPVSAPSGAVEPSYNFYSTPIMTVSGSTLTITL